MANKKKSTGLKKLLSNLESKAVSNEYTGLKKLGREKEAAQVNAPMMEGWFRNYFDKKSDLQREHDRNQAKPRILRRMK